MESYFQNEAENLLLMISSNLEDVSINIIKYTLASIALAAVHDSELRDEAEVICGDEAIIKIYNDATWILGK